MRQIPFNYSNDTCKGVGLDIKWQTGLIKDGVANGSTVEQVIRAAILRLEHYQTTLPCEENLQAIESLYLGIRALERRARDRARRGVMGTESL